MLMGFGEWRRKGKMDLDVLADGGELGHWKERLESRKLMNADGC